MVSGADDARSTFQTLVAARKNRVGQGDSRLGVWGHQDPRPVLRWRLERSVVVACLQKIDTLVADPVHQAVLLRDTP